MLTTTLDGLWALQVLSGIEVLAPELGLRPHLPSVETRQAALAHPVAEELLAAGIIDASGTVDATVLEWLTVLSRRDIALLLHTRGLSGALTRTLLARFAQWWVSIELSDELITLSGVATTSCEQSAVLAIVTQIDRLCGQMPTSRMRPVSFRTDELLGAVRDEAGLQKFLRHKRFEADQIRTLTLAADPERSRQTSIVAIRSTHIEPGALTIIDTPEGRLVAEHVSHASTGWMVVTPGSSDALASAVRNLMRRLPHSWCSHRKAV